MIIIYSLLIILIVVCGCGIGYIVIYNRIQHYLTKVDQGESIIDDTLRTRYDLIKKAGLYINEVTDQKKAFKEIDDLEKEDLSSFDMDRRLTDIVSLIYQLKNDFNDLQSNKEFKDIVNNLKSTDEKIQAAKSYYNKYTNLLNDQIRKFPANIIAKMHDIKERLFFDGKNMHDEITNDFKL